MERGKRRSSHGKKRWALLSSSTALDAAVMSNHLPGYKLAAGKRLSLLKESPKKAIRIQNP